MILAAGNGKRMKSALPKVLHSVAGKPMLRHVMDLADSLHPVQNIVVTHPALQPYYHSFSNIKESADFIVQPQQLGTADAVKTGLSCLKNPDTRILILYGDTPLVTKETLQRLLELKSDLALLGFNAVDPTGYGRMITKKNDQIVAIIEEKDATSAQKALNLCYSGIMAVSAALLRELLTEVSNQNASGEYYLTDIIKFAVLKKRTCEYIVCGQEELIGVNDRHQLLLANQLFQIRKAYEVIEKGATLIAPETVFFSHDTHIGMDVLIHPYVTFGPGVSVGNNTIIHSFSHIEGASIGNHCSIGPFARLRPGTQLASQVKVGNFVELKQTVVGKGSKINHLSYIGDATLQEDVNIGAGTITCNYDGFKKSHTAIGSHVFIGSNTALVAPLIIQDGSMIGAGSTITQDIPTDTLAIARSKQISIPDGATRYRKKYAPAPQEKPEGN